MCSTQISQLSAVRTKLCLSCFMRVGHTSFLKFNASAYLGIFPGVTWGSVVEPQIILETVDLTLVDKKLDMS